MIKDLALQYRRMMQHEKELALQGYQLIAGVDEAGRGPVAGPIFAAAVILDPDKPILGLNDSKKLSEKKRNELFTQIQSQALAYAVAQVTAADIDQFGIGAANANVMYAAISGLKIQPDFILIDYFKLTDLTIPHQSLIKGDAVSNSIAAASILAKVSRDQYMTEVDALYPSYGFAKHKGYGTKSHREAIATNGLVPEHRRSFLTKWQPGV